ncbi:MAG: hypothetical protein DM484_09915 [Candidatus Methylumidiphilus alinenensis]|uniref:Uncharacterized protein n=1 Tax=Candidatus Methylumidiphilus alinenensis TaxID=2202197 RepID=A0A2W4RKU4_9GAMM|nr:MAG: hypothetical protein DM484_09915 [Candidatus Methylumidiphilus alinenensis]
MTTFLRLLAETDKATALQAACTQLRRGETDPRHFEVAPDSFNAVPGKPFAYWVSDSVRKLFNALSELESDGVVARRGVNSNDDNRFIRLFWEVEFGSQIWEAHVKGGEKSTYYLDPSLVINWGTNGHELEAE